MELQLAWPGGGAAVTAGPRHADTHRSVEAADQVGDDNDAAGQDTDDDERRFRPLATDIRREAVDPGREFGGGEENTHGGVGRQDE